MRKIIIVALSIVLSIGVYAQMTENTCVRRTLNYAKWTPEQIVNQLTLSNDPWNIDSNYVKDGVHVISMFKEPYRVTVSSKGQNGMIMLTTPSYTLDAIQGAEELKSVGLKKTREQKGTIPFATEIWDNMGDYKPNPTIVLVQYYTNKITYTTGLTKE